MFKLMNAKTSTVQTYLNAGLDAVLCKHATKINSLNDLKRITGSKFTFFDFCDLIVEVACHSFSGDKSLLPAEMLSMCLERMELSKGMRELDRRNACTH